MVYKMFVKLGSRHGLWVALGCNVTLRCLMASTSVPCPPFLALVEDIHHLASWFHLTGFSTPSWSLDHILTSGPLFPKNVMYRWCHVCPEAWLPRSRDAEVEPRLGSCEVSCSWLCKVPRPPLILWFHLLMRFAEINQGRCKVRDYVFCFLNIGLS